MNGSGSDVNVRFGGDTRGLDQATARAKRDISSLRPTVQGLGTTLTQLKGQITSAFNMPNLGAAQSAIGGMGLQLRGVGVTAEGVAARMGGVGLAVAAVTVGVVALSAALVSSALSFGRTMGEAAEKTGQLAQKLNMSASEVGGWSVVAKAAGMSTESWASSMTRLERAQVLSANGGKKQTAAFRELGIEVGKTRDQNELMLQMADKFSKMEAGPKKIELAMRLMGRAGADMIPIFNMGREAIERQIATAKEYGAVLSDDMVEAGKRVDDAFDEMDMAMMGLKNTLFSALAPAIQVTVQYFNSLAKEMVESYRAGGLVRTIADVIVVGFKVMVTAIAEVILAFKLLYHTAMAALTPIVGTLSAVAEGVANAVSGNWSQIGPDLKRHMGGVANNTIGHLKSMGNAALGFGKTMRGLWLGEGLGVSKPRPKSEDGGLGIGGGGGAKQDKKAKANNDALNAALEELEFKKEMARDDFAVQMQLQEEKLALLKRAYGEDSQEYIRALREKQKMARDHDQEIVGMERDRISLQTQIARDGAETQRQIAQEALDVRRQMIEFDASNGVISEGKKVASLRRVAAEEQQIERDSVTRIYQIQRAGFEAELALQNLRPQERRRVLDQMALAEAKFNNDMRALSARQNSENARLAADAAQATINKWRGVVAPIQSAFGQMFQSLYTRQATFKQAMLTAIDSIVMHWAQKGLEMLANWAVMQFSKKAVTASADAAEVATHTATEAAKTGVTTAAVTARAGIETTALATATVAGIASRVSQVMGLAGVAAAAAFASTAAIPIVGPALAPAAAAAALGTVMSFVPLASAARGWGEVPRDGMRTELHKKEMVLPAKFASPLRQMLQGGGWSPGALGVGSSAAAMAGSRSRAQMNDNSSRGGPTFNYQPKHDNHHADLGSLLEREGATMRKWFHNQVRNGAMRVE